MKAIDRLKAKILDLAIRGKLVPQDPSDEPASELLKKIRTEKEQLIKEKKIKKEKNPSEIIVGSDGAAYHNRKALFRAKIPVAIYTERNSKTDPFRTK